MKIDLSKWELHPQENEQARKIALNFLFKDPVEEMILLLPPKKRVKVRRKYYKILRNQLLENFTFESYRWAGEKPSGRFIGTILMKDLPTIEALELDSLTNVYVDNIENATKRVEEEKNEEEKLRYFCVKMTLSIEIEGFRKGKQLYEKRYVLIRATSEEEAKQTAWDRRLEDNETEPYFNDDLRLVRWRVESIDDCYETYISSLEMPLNYKSETIEVFSILKYRKLTKKRRWDGKF